VVFTVRYFISAQIIDKQMIIPLRILWILILLNVSTLIYLSFMLVNENSKDCPCVNSSRTSEILQETSSRNPIVEVISAPRKALIDWKPCSKYRGFYEGILSPKECRSIIELGMLALKKEDTGNFLEGAPLDHFFGGKVWKSFPFDFLQLFMDARERMRQQVMKHFHLTELFFEFTEITARKPSGKMESHPAHSDNCKRTLNGSCVFDKQYCCSWRHFSSILYLNEEGVDFHGGGTFFSPNSCYNDTEKMIFLPYPGSLLLFSSGPENEHGVLSIQDGVRWAIAIWYTLDRNRAEILLKDTDDQWQLQRGT